MIAAAALLIVFTQAAFAEGYVLPELIAGVSQFRPFGWAADGTFAWLESRDIDGRGGTVYTYTVYDAVEDAVVYTHSDDSFDWGQDVDATEEERAGDLYTASLKVTNDPSKDEYDDQVVQSYSVILSSRNRGSKVVTASGRRREGPARGS